MDEKRFDELAKQLSTTRLTRVSMIRGLAAGAVAALTGARLASQSGGSTVLAAAGTCRNLGHPCEGNQDCCAGIEFCEATGPGGAKRCSDVPGCGGLGEVCCEGQCDRGLECDETDHCVDPDPECGALGQPCCPGCEGDLVCDTSLNPPDGTCVECTDDTDCGNNEVCCGDPGVCFTGECCGNEDCVGNETCNANHQCVGPTPPPGPTPTSCPAGQALVGGRCVFLGLRCKTTETPLKCCYRAVVRGCKRKQQSKTARKNCLKRGKKRCRKLLAGIS